MLEQSFALSDIPRILTLAFLEMLLSADNAIVLGLLARSLPNAHRKKAFFIGLASSFLLRAAAILAVATLLKYSWIQLAGAAYLLYLPLRHFTKKPLPAASPTAHSFWKTVLLIELFDLIFAIDSIVAGVAFIETDLSKLWIVYAGGMIGLIGMRYAAGLFSWLVDRFPRLEHSAYLMVGWIGIKLGLAALSYPLPSPLFWILLAFFFLLGLI